MNTIKIILTGCMLFVGIGVHGSGGGGAGKEISVRNRFLDSWCLLSEEKEALYKIYNGNIDELVADLNNENKSSRAYSIKYILSVLLGSKIIPGLADELKVEAVQKLWAVDKSVMSRQQILAQAIENKHRAVVEYMMSQDEDGLTYSMEKWIKNPKRCATPTHFALEFNRRARMLALFDPRDCLVRDKQDDTPLHIEFKNAWGNIMVPNYKRIDCLIEKMVSQAEDHETRQRENKECLSMVDANGDSFLHLAFKSNYYKEYVTELLDYGVDVDQINDDGCSPLMLAARIHVREIFSNRKGWTKEEKQLVFDRLLESTSNLEAFGAGPNSILFDPFVLGNCENFQKVINRIKTLFDDDADTFSRWIADQRIGDFTILEFLMNFDKDGYVEAKNMGIHELYSHVAGKKIIIRDYVNHVRVLWEAQAVDQDMLKKAQEFAVANSSLSTRCQNIKMQNLLAEEENARVEAAIAAASERFASVEAKLNAYFSQQLIKTEAERSSEVAQAAAEQRAFKQARVDAEQARIAALVEAERIAQEAAEDAAIRVSCCRCS